MKDCVIYLFLPLLPHAQYQEFNNSVAHTRNDFQLSNEFYSKTSAIEHYKLKSKFLLRTLFRNIEYYLVFPPKGPDYGTYFCVHQGFNGFRSLRSFWKVKHLKIDSGIYNNQGELRIKICNDRDHENCCLIQNVTPYVGIAASQYLILEELSMTTFMFACLCMLCRDPWKIFNSKSTTEILP